MRRRALGPLLAILVATILLPAAAPAEESPLAFFRHLLHGPTARVHRRAAPQEPAAPTPAPADIPLPHLNPHEATAATVRPLSATHRAALPIVVPEPQPPAAMTAVVPLPREKPETPAAPPPTGARIAMLPPPSVLAPLAAPAEDCRAALAALGVEAIPLVPIDDDRCQVAAPMAVSAFAGGTVSLLPKAILDCPMAEALAGWLKKDVTPAATALGGRVTGLRIAASYDCRNRDNLANEKLSEHAFANALDISAFQIDGNRWITIGGDKKDQVDDARFLDAVRVSACGPFTTVLGPGSDGYHSSHFHLDLAKRGRNGHALYCK
jgi:hypothetical protein